MPYTLILLWKSHELAVGRTRGDQERCSSDRCRSKHPAASRQFLCNLRVAIQKRQHLFLYIDIRTSDTKHYSLDA